MFYKHISNNLYLGDQYSQPQDITCAVRATNTFYYYFKNKHRDKIIDHNDYLLYENTIDLNLDDGFIVEEISVEAIKAAIAFLLEHEPKEKVYVHCQRGVSRSPTVVFIYLVITKQIDKPTLSTAIEQFITKFYPNMSVNDGVYQLLEQNFPFANWVK